MNTLQVRYELPPNFAAIEMRKSLNPSLERRRVLSAIATRLSGPLYGYAVPFEKAKVLIKRDR